MAVQPFAIAQDQTQGHEQIEEKADIQHIVGRSPVVALRVKGEDGMGQRA